MYTVFCLGKPEGKRSLATLNYKLENNTKMHPKKKARRGKDWIDLA